MPSSILNTLHGHGRLRRHAAQHNDSNSQGNQSPSLRVTSSQSSSASSSSSTLSPTTSPMPGSVATAKKRAVGLKLNFRIESPPLIMYGTPNESTGALLSGILDLSALPSADSKQLELSEAEMAVVQEIKYTVPPAVASKLAASVKVEELASWNVLLHAHKFERGATFGYPFSHLLPGNLPPSCKSRLFSIRYYLRASCREATTGQSVTHTQDISVGRSIIPGDKTSVRIFPPTDLSLSMVLPNSVFPQSTIRAEMRLEGLVGKPDPRLGGKIQRWQVKRINWRVDEITKVMLPAPPSSDGTQTDAPPPFEDKHTLSYGQRKNGWKSDYTGPKGISELISNDFCPGALERLCKDVSDPVSGIFVNHILVVEALIAEEVLSSPKAKQGMLTGSARILRMQFNIPVMDRPGLGISWDDEVPPSYADVPLSPPTYSTGAVGNLPSFEEVAHMTFSPALSPIQAALPSPTLRHVDGTLRGPEGNNWALPNVRPSIGRTTSTQARATLGNPRLAPSSSNNSPALMPVQSMPTPGAANLINKLSRSLVNSDA